MSGFAAVFQRDGGTVDPGLMPVMLRTMPERGPDRSAAWTEGPVSVGVARHAWELASGFSGSSLLSADEGFVVAADASLYYRDELRQRLARAGRPSDADTPSDLILGAYRAWGERCVEHLEGDFAFVVWDRRAGTLFCGRDLLGSRPLFFAELGDAVVVGSTVGAVLADPRCPRTLNRTLIAEVAAGLHGVDDESCFAAVEQLPAGCSILFRRGGRERRRFWSPPSATPFRRASFEEGALELRGLLARAVEERLDPGAPTSVWMSGGCDSPAVFAAGRNALAGLADSAHGLRPVSMSYPPGDPGREDELIESILERWGASTQWVDVGSVPAIPQAGDGLAPDDCFVSAYSEWNRALAEGSRATGARVALTGSGGDTLFACAPIHWSDLFYGGRWLSLAREWQARGSLSWRGRFRWSVRPGLPGALCSAAAALRGGDALLHPLAWRRAPWVPDSVVARHHERERVRGFAATGRGLDASFRRALTMGYGARVHAATGSMAQALGVELRHPLMDRRVIEFAIRRPWWEVSWRRETKRLLRRSMAGLLPDHVLAPRGRRTGTCDGRFEADTRTLLPRLIEAELGRSHLADWGALDPDRLRRAARAFGEGAGTAYALPLLWTLQTERWLRRLLDGAPQDGKAGCRPASAAAAFPVQHEIAVPQPV